MKTVHSLLKMITDDGRTHFDPSPYYFGGSRYIMPGDGNNSIIIYKEENGSFTEYKDFKVDTSNSNLIEPCSVLSNEPFVIGGQYFSIFLTSECHNTGNGAFVQSNGEVFLIGVETDVNHFMGISPYDSNYVKNEPEVCVTSRNKAFVYYNAFPDDQNALTATYELRMIPIELKCHDLIDLDQEVIPSNEYAAAEVVKASGMVKSDSMVAFLATDSILLEPGFLVDNGGTSRSWN